jgi:flagellar biogenesis protein FliO
MKSAGMAKYIVFSVLGFVVMVAGILLAVLWPDNQGIMLTLPYVCIGIGAGIFGGCLGTSIRIHLLKKNPQASRQNEIEARDERNIAINNKAKAKAFDLMKFLFCGLILAFALLQASLWVVLSMVAAYLLLIFSMLYFINKFQKEM